MSESSPVESLCDNNSENLDLDLSNFFNKFCSISKKRSNMANNNEPPQQVPVLDIKNLSIIPNFDGNSNKLFRFISASESILTHYADRRNPASFQNHLLLNGILNKLEGRAEEVVSINGNKDWGSIKQTLIQNFGDQRDENSLNLDLVNMKQKSNETPEQFHERILHILNTICNYIDLHGANDVEKQFKRDFFTKQALKSFLAGLKEPLGPIIRAMRPNSLAQAIQFISEENNIIYYQRSSHSSHSTNQVKHQARPIFQPLMYQQPSTSQNQYISPQFSQQSQQRFFPQPTQLPRFPQFPQNIASSQFPRGPIDIRPIANPPQRKFPTNTQVFGKPKNVWTPNSRNAQPRPQPMSICATTTQNRQPQNYRPSYNHFANRTNQARPGVIIEEVFNTEFAEQPQNAYENNYETTPEGTEPEHDYYYDENSSDDPQNFQETPNSNEMT